MSKNRLTIALIAALILGGSAAAQTINTTVNGTVRDEAGAVIPGAKVTLLDISTRREVTATTNDQGGFVFTDVRPGGYLVAAEREGFKKAEVRDVQVNVNVPATVNVVLAAGQIADVVTTTASDAQLVVNTENGALQTTVFERQINDLPLNARNPLDLANLQAGVNQSGANREATVNGLRGTFSNLTWDGINIQDNFIRTDTFFAVAAPSVISVSEFTLTTQNGGAQDGLGVAQVKLVTPRGSTAYHGQLFEFHRNDVFDANSFFNNATGVPKEKLIRNQFGFGVGGPIKFPKKIFGPLGFDTEKLFFYGYYEGTRERTQLSLLRQVLTQSARDGRFTYRRSDNGQLQTVNLLGLAGTSGVPDPLTRQLVNLTPLPNDLASGDLANIPGAASLSNTAGYRFNTGTGSGSDLFGFRVDFDATSKHRFEAIFSRFGFDFPNDPFNQIEEPFPGRPGGGQTSTRPRGSFAWNWTPSASLNNEVRFGFNNYNVDFVLNEPHALGFRVVFPLITDPIQNNLGQGRRADSYEVIDNTTWVKGNHQVRFGGNYRRVYIEPYDFLDTIPEYTIGYNTTGNPNPIRRAQFPGGISANDFTRAGDVLAILTGPVAEAEQQFNVTSRISGFVAGAPQSQQFFYWNVAGYANDT